jgi:hypothetical protein
MLRRRGVPRGGLCPHAADQQLAAPEGGRRGESGGRGAAALGS